MSFIICLCCSCSLSVPFWGSGVCSALQHGAPCIHTCALAHLGWSALLLLSLALAMWLVMAEMKKYQFWVWTSKVLPLFCFPSCPSTTTRGREALAHLLVMVPGRGRGTWSRASSSTCRPPVRSSAVHSHPFKISQTQWPQMLGRRCRKHSGWSLAWARCLQSLLHRKALRAGPGWTHLG